MTKKQSNGKMQRNEELLEADMVEISGGKDALELEDIAPERKTSIPKRTNSTVKIAMDPEERQKLYETFWESDDRMNALIQEAVYSPVKKDLLDKIIYIWSCECAHKMAPEFRQTVHAGVEEGDVAGEMFIIYLQMDLKEVSQKANPKRYICRALINRRQRYFSSEKTLFNVIGKTSGTVRSEYMKALRGENESVRNEVLTKEQQKIAERIAANNGSPAQLDAPIRNRTARGSGGGAVTTVINSVTDPESLDEYLNLLSRKSVNDFIIKFFPDQMMRVMFSFIYLCAATVKLAFEKRVENAFIQMNKLYGIDREEFDLCEADMRRFMKAEKKEMQKFLISARAA